jgi:hypothetical protein
LAGISDFRILDLAEITDYNFRILANPKYFGFRTILTFSISKLTVFSGFFDLNNYHY